MSENVINNIPPRADRSTISTVLSVTMAVCIGGIVAGVITWYNEGEKKTEERITKIEYSLETLSGTVNQAMAAVTTLADTMSKQVQKVRDDVAVKAADRFYMRQAVKNCLENAMANPGWICVNPEGDGHKFYYVGMGRETMQGWEPYIEKSRGKRE